MQIFIVRPFGTKKVLKEKAEDVVEINFDKVQEELVDPALAALNLDGGTTGLIFEPGDIRDDMFSLLLRAEIVIADITIHNANVFYELGIRHALRDKMTILIKSPGVSDTPFDIIGYRYVTYDRSNPGNAVSDLIQTLKDTIDTKRVDSPVFKMLPKLKVQDYEKFIAVPESFADEVRIAAQASLPGKLSLLAYEADSFHWRIPGLRLTGEALYQLKAYDSARIVFEKIKNVLPDDIQAHERLATIYQRISEREMTNNSAMGLELLAKSDISVDFLLSDPTRLDREKRAEAYALKGRNIKSKWIGNWRPLGSDKKGISALQSDLLQESYEAYQRGYFQNLNQYYPGINALSLLTILLELIEKYPDAWNNKFAKTSHAQREKEDLSEKKTQLIAALELTIEAEKEEMRSKGQRNTWLEITTADFSFLTEKNTGRITAGYASALEGASAFSYEAVFRQLRIFEELGILQENVTAAVNTIPGKFKGDSKSIVHTLLFTGHMIDKPDRKEPRFPPSMEDAAREKIKEMVEAEMNSGRELRGISGGACGGDILFHEVCLEAGISTELYLALPREDFIKSSVEFAGYNWIDRFNKIFNSVPRHVLCDKPSLPKWLEKRKSYNIWMRNNLWELNDALVNGGMHVTLIALWDGKGGDGPGGTAHMIEEVRSRGARIRIIDTNALL